jgi:RecA-family ATPase
VIVDALADVMPGRDENAVKDTAPIFLTLRKIAEETQCAIIVIHHSNKTGGYRGSSAIKGAIDLLLSVEKKNEITHMISNRESAIPQRFFRQR